MGIAQLVECPTENPGTVLTQVRVPSVARFFSLSQFPGQTVLRCPYSLCVQSHASTSVRTLKFPNTGTVAATPLFGHSKVLHTLIAMGSAALAAAVHYPGKGTRTSCKGQ